MKANHLYRPTNVHLYDGKIITTDVFMVNETELAVYLNQFYITTLLASPGAEPELAVGYLLSEGIIGVNSRLVSLKYSPGQIDLSTCEPSPEVNGAEGVALKMEKKTRSIDPDGAVQFRAEHLLKLVQELEHHSYTFKLTGGVHSAALADSNSILLRYEDIGRHNAFDKVVGHAYLQKIPLRDKCLVLSGRITREIMAKAVSNEIPLLVSRSAPTLESVHWAERMGISVVGFARGQRFNIYSHPQRIVV
ncbi:MAG: formate dehydrogenase accessory sulfurtransferase FdhD [Syntrophomonadaceae bacterium]|jgi:FdhD protein|nr:formate dehydrogenase accessory sulfurtransferase FdhD [Syntrophomonadaceae bacterium]